MQQLIDREELLKKYLEHWKDFKNDISVLAYIFAIIDNNINDVYKKMRSQNKKTALPESTDYVESVNLADIGTSKKGRDISEFLEA